MKKFWILFILPILFNLPQPAQAQDVEFSQYYAAPLHLNPALAGIAQGPRFNLNYRNQWPGVNNAYVTYAASYDQHFDALNGGIGLIIMADRQADGLLNSYNAGLMYSYQLAISNNFGLKLGAQVSAIHSQIDWNGLTFYDQLDPIDQLSTEPAPEQTTKTNVDFSAGVIAFSDKHYFGVSAKHLSQPNMSFHNNNDKSARLPLRTSLHAGSVFKLSQDRNRLYYFSPNALLVQQSNFLQLNVGSYVQIGWLYGGAWYRHTINNSDALIALLGVSYGSVRFGYSYDFTVSQMARNSGGAHELSLSLNLGDGSSLSAGGKSSQLSCPPFLR